MPVQLDAREVAIVILAEYHNPSILNHDFLVRNGIIADKWGAATDFVSVPAFSSVTYKEMNIKISCQEERLQFEKRDDIKVDNISDLIDCASRYVRILEHVNYKALGVNCDYRIKVEGVATWAKNHFISAEILKENPDIANARTFFWFDETKNESLVIEFRPLSGTNALRIRANYQIDELTNVSALVANIGRANEIRAKSESRAGQILGKQL